MNAKLRTTLLIVLPVLAALILGLMGGAIYLDLNNDGNENGDDYVRVDRVLPEARDDLFAYVKAEMQAMEAEGKLTNDNMTMLFSDCDVDGIIRLTKEGQSYITAKDGGKIMLSELSSTYVHRITQKTFDQIIELSETYITNVKELKYDNFYTPFNESTTNHLDCSSFTQLMLYGIPYETSRYVADVNTSRYNFGISLPKNPYRTEYGPNRYLANDLAHYAFDNDLAFYPNADGTNMQPGDIVFFSTNNRNEGYFMNVTHVGICVERRDGDALYIVHGNSNDVCNYFEVHLFSEYTPLGSKNAYNNSLVLIARFPVLEKN